MAPRSTGSYLRRLERRGLRAARTYDGMMVIEVVMPLEEGEEGPGPARRCKGRRRRFS